MDIEHRVRTLALAGAALCATGIAAEADELAALTAELNALESRIIELEAAQDEESTHEPSVVPSRTPSAITLQRGTGAASNWTVDRAGDWLPSSRGLTIAVTPTADLPTPVHEVTVSGYVKGDFIYDFRQDLGDYFDYSQIFDDRYDRKHVRLHARQTRFRIQSKSDTAIGQIRTLIEGDFYSGGSFGGVDFRMRHAWGEWDITPNWTFGAGQTWRNFMSLITGITTVDFNGPVGLLGTTRVGQLRLTYRNGPQTFAVAVEDSSGENEWIYARGRNDDMPDVSGRWQYDSPGGHQFLISAAGRRFVTERQLGAFRSDDALGWVVQGAATINLADLATFSTSVIYGDGVGNYILGNGPAYWVDPTTGKMSTISALGLFAGVGIPVTDTTSVNIGWGMARPDRGDIKHAAILGAPANHLNREVMSIHGNIIWNPVNELRLGWEIIYAEREYYDAADTGRVRRGDNIRGQFGAWFFF
ncbi:porin [Rhodoligotrophos ferricapiens]|uniref:porin n=1 Tax=Rhodoligotrophos ferricapiens TaxID=3069264 RepID=UPI00315DD7D7